MKTDVIFRKFKDGDIIAFFPGIAFSNNPYNCASYMHAGQHGNADPALVADTKLAKPEEYAPLKQELERIGYALRVVSRFTPSHLSQRKAQV